MASRAQPFRGWKIYQRNDGGWAAERVVTRCLKTGKADLGGHDGGLSIFDYGRFRIPSGPALPEEAVCKRFARTAKERCGSAPGRDWPAMENRTTRFLTKKDGLAADDTHAILEASNGDLWVGGYGGLTRIRNGKFSRWTEKDGLPSGNIWSFYEDSEGTLWIGTYDGGLARFKDGKITSYSVKDGLFDEGVFRILEDAHGYFWISCSRGVYLVKQTRFERICRG